MRYIRLTAVLLLAACGNRHTRFTRARVNRDDRKSMELKRGTPGNWLLSQGISWKGNRTHQTEVRKAVREESPGCETLTTMYAAWSRQDFLQELSCSPRSLGERPGMRHVTAQF